MLKVSPSHRLQQNQDEADEMYRPRLIYVIIITQLVLLSLHGQHFGDVIEYVPAPGQHINTAAGSMEAAASLKGSSPGLVSLGSFGGTLVARFETPVDNHPENPYGVDFTIFGNALPHWSEPGFVFVMKDVNGNGLPDDVWYELSGSDHYFSTTRKDYMVTYTNPGDAVQKPVPWSDNLGHHGDIPVNEIHQQPYYPLVSYFPEIDRQQYTLTGTCLHIEIDSTQGFFKSHLRRFGYADNLPRASIPDLKPDNPYTIQVEGSGGDAMDISWAMDTSGNYVTLDSIHFIKIQTGALNYGGPLGEISTEISGLLDVEADTSMAGETRCVAITELPYQLHPGIYQLEAFAFDHGILQPEVLIRWDCNPDVATITEEGELTIHSPGELTVTARYEAFDEVYTRITRIVEFPAGIIDGSPGTGLFVYPNPFTEEVHIVQTSPSDILIYNIHGQLVWRKTAVCGTTRIHTESWDKGIFLLKSDTGDSHGCIKMIRR